jgi:hypothetical protein
MMKGGHKVPTLLSGNIDEDGVGEVGVILVGDLFVHNGNQE